VPPVLAGPGGRGQTQPQVSIWLRKYAKAWLDNPALIQIRDEVVALLDARAAEALIAARGSYTH
jgi:hypothetical protein